MCWRERRRRKPLVLRGARQVGKTWLLKWFGGEFRRAHYVNFEDARDLAGLFAGGLRPNGILQQLAILRNMDVDPQRDLLVFDEIQQEPEALTSLKYFREELPELAVCTAGSHLGVALGAASFPVGQVDYLDLYPMSFAEFLAAIDPRSATFLQSLGAHDRIPDPVHARLWDHLKHYMIVGGLPEAVQAYCNALPDLVAAFAAARDVQSGLVEGYRSDFAKHAGKQNATHINRVFDTVPQRLARAVDTHVGRFRFKDVIPGYSKFAQLAGPIDWLAKAGLLLRARLVSRPEIPLVAYAADNRFKLYMFDIGLLGAMLDLPFAAVLKQDFGSYKGYIAENLVAQELTAAGKGPLYWWEGRQSEIEFLLREDERIVPVEVKAGCCGRSRSLTAYRAKFAPERAVKLTARSLDQPTPHTLNVPLYLAAALPM